MYTFREHVEKVNKIRHERKRVAVNNSKRDLSGRSGRGGIRGKPVESPNASMLRSRKLRGRKGHDLTYDFRDYPASDYQLMYET